MKPSSHPTPRDSFTPGPWSVRQSRADLTYTHIGSATNESIACTKSEDDARLIAAAPDLLDYLKRVVEEARASQKTGVPFDRPALLAGADLVRNGLKNSRNLVDEDVELSNLRAAKFSIEKAIESIPSATLENPAQSVPDGMWYFTFYCEDRDAVQRARVAADAPRQFTCGVTGIAKKEASNA